MNYHSKYLKYKTKYMNLKILNSYKLSGGTGKLCLPDPKGRYSTYEKCNKAGESLFKCDEGAPDECNLSNTFIDTTPIVPIRGAITSMSQMWEVWGEYFVRLGNCFHCKEPVFKVDKNMKNKPYYAVVWRFKGITYQSKIHHNLTVVTHIKDECFNSFLNNIVRSVF